MTKSPFPEGEGLLSVYAASTSTTSLSSSAVTRSTSVWLIGFDHTRPGSASWLLDRFVAKAGMDKPRDAPTTI